MSLLSGNCLCGDVQFSGEGPLQRTSACHCQMCQRWSGGGPLYCGHFQDGVTLTQSESLVWWESSDHGQRGFCRTCGTNLFWRTKGEARDFAVSPALIDGAEYRVAEHIFIDEKPDYYDLNDDAPRKTGAQLIAERTAKI